MAKGIRDVIDDRIDDGLDAWRVAIMLAKTDRFPDVVDQAEAASRALTTAIEAWHAVASTRSKCVADERALAKAEDPRQGKLPGTEPEVLCHSCANAYSSDPSTCPREEDLNPGEECADYVPTLCRSCALGDAGVPGGDCSFENPASGEDCESFKAIEQAEVDVDPDTDDLNDGESADD